MSLSQPPLAFNLARATALERIRPLGVRRIPLKDCLGLVAAEDIVSQDNIPYAANSAMDGFAVIASDTKDASSCSPVSLRIVDTIEAGQEPSIFVRPCECARIMTGAMMPQGADAVVRIESTISSGDLVRIAESVKPGSDVRLPGEDIAEGEVAVTAGTELRPYEIGLLAAIGAAEPLVRPRPRVAVIATGSELVPVATPLSPGKVRNSNAAALYAQCLALGAVPVDFGVVEDTDEATQAALERAAAECDVVVTTGAVSMGERDRVGPAMERLGKIVFWRVAMRPGSPLLFGEVREKPCFCLPGNPASAMLTFELFVRPALRKMMGHTALFRPVEQARAAEDFSPRGGVTLFLRAITERRDGELWVRKSGLQGSGMHKPFARADSLAVVEQDRPAAEGDYVPIILLNAPER